MKPEEAAHLAKLVADLRQRMKLITKPSRWNHYHLDELFDALAKYPYDMLRRDGWNPFQTSDEEMEARCEDRTRRSPFGRD